ncbi:AMP-binding protein [Actinomycetota bacterium Odt1-20B]
MPLAHRVAESAAGPRQDRAAFVLDGRVQTYRRLAARAAAVSAGLREVASRHRSWQRPGDRLLALGTGNHPAFAELFVGATAGDGACAVLDPSWGAEQTRSVLIRLRPDLLVLPSGRPDLRKAAAGLGIHTLVAGEDGSPSSSPSTYETWLAGHRDADPAAELVAGDAATPFLVGFTSGSTGVPNAFYRSRGSWRVSLAEGHEVWGVDADAHTFAPGPLAHGLSLYAFAECLESGAAFHGLSSFDADAVVRRLATAELRRLVLVPTMIIALGSAARAAGQKFPGVRAVISGGAKLDPQLVPAVAEVLPEAHVTEYYGASELGFVTVGAPGAEPAARDVGLPWPSVTLQIRDENGASVAPGSPGLVHVRSPLRCSGYLWGEGSYRTDGEWATVGDLGRLSEDGHLHLIGRGDMVVTGGLNVYPAEVEAALLRLPGVDTAIVTGIPDDYLGTALVAALGGPGADGLTAARIRELCGPALPRYKVPRRFYAVSEWPLTGSGKIARGRIEEWIAHDDARLAPLPPGTPS